MLGLGVMILSMAIIRGFKAEIREKIRGFAGDVQIVKSDLNNSYENSSFIPEPGLIAKLTANKYVAHINAFATKPGIIKANNDREGVIMKGVDKNYDWDYMKKMLVSGSVIDFRDSADAMKQVMVSQVIAKRLQLKAGDDLLDRR
jgi:lipoprotein-releasing system permease protein